MKSYKGAMKLVRDELMNGLEQCAPHQQKLFKRMYGTTETPLNSVVNAMPECKLEWAFYQVQRTLEVNTKKAKHGIPIEV